MGQREENKRWKELQQQRKLLEALIVEGSRPLDYALPSISEFVLSEVVNAAVASVGADVNPYLYLENRGEDGFHYKLEEYFNKAMLTAPGELHSQVIKVFKPLITTEHVPADGYLTGPYQTNYLVNVFHGQRGCICPVDSHSTYVLDFQLIKRVEQEFLPSLTKPHRESIEAIGIHMTQFIEDDLEYVKNTYVW